MSGGIAHLCLRVDQLVHSFLYRFCVGLSASGHLEVCFIAHVHKVLFAVGSRGPGEIMYLTIGTLIRVREDLHQRLRLEQRRGFKTLCHIERIVSVPRPETGIFEDCHNLGVGFLCPRLDLPCQFLVVTASLFVEFQLPLIRSTKGPILIPCQACHKPLDKIGGNPNVQLVQ